MRWEATRFHDRERHGDAVKVAVALSALAMFALAMLALAPNVQAQNTPATVPSVSYAPGQEATIQGLIISRDGDDMMLHDDQGHLTLVTLTAETKISSLSPISDGRRRDMTSLLPGSSVEVQGSGGPRGNLVADRIAFHSSSPRSAQQVAAGTLALSRKTGADTDSVEGIDRYAAKGSAIVNFAANSAILDDHAKSRLDAIADAAVQQPGYLLEVRSYTDSRSAEATNQDLGVRRAQAIVDYLAQRKNVPLRRILNPAGYGEIEPGGARNRGSEVRIRVNQGIK